MAKTKIEWTATYNADGTVSPGYTFNPWVGCTRVSPGCVHCYAETMMDKRYGKVKWGPQGKRVRTSPAYWRQPLKWNREAAAAGERRRVFCASLADVFEAKTDQAIDMHSWRTGLFSLIKMTPHLDWLLLTKRPENINALAPWYTDNADEYPNVWLGTSVENQEQANKRIPHLLAVPAAIHFLSVEPLLGPVRLDDGYASWLTCNGKPDNGECCESFWSDGDHYHGVDWVIVGGESGHNARPMNPDWVRSIRDQCQAAGVPFFFKQWGEWGITRPIWTRPHEGLTAWTESNGKNYYMLGDGIDTKHWRIDKIGKKAAGRLLDGREWNEMPSSRRQWTRPSVRTILRGEL